MKKIMYENRWKLIFSSVIILIPQVIAFFMKENLYYLPLEALVIHWLCLLITFCGLHHAGDFHCGQCVYFAGEIRKVKLYVCAFAYVSGNRPDVYPDRKLPSQGPAEQYHGD